ncbi:DUF4129 domain-containing protein [Myceligenerans pegani]|uniref:DUF4129 domain-containing protein n=1 Tax=Myceligenerans pegani TaxID=2776917 RepID=A0ABR9MY91_9MICO|nr:DUF4129 domain-containing protein [Myceligenerans sp. TRM 65318]MBE1876350.1 DUF4129 domain-containing protein [Myceligenerans sp. TRM 65318]MBE3018621.1 DUF4129 domain-containing protein [Myceligenerans sp. TRM 65318]
MTPRTAPPVEPGREEAHDWLRTELQRAEYAERESLLQRLIDAVVDWFRGLEVPDAGLPGTQLAIVIVVLVLVVLAIAWFVAGPVRRERGVRRSAAVVEKDDARTAAQMRAAADAAARSGDWSAAVAERYRAVVRSCEERAVIDSRPGRTAQEAANDIGVRLPGLAARLHLAAGLFDQVEYGGLGASAPDDTALRELDDAVAAARVERKEPAAPGAGPGDPASPARTSGDTAGAASAGSTPAHTAGGHHTSAREVDAP